MYSPPYNRIEERAELVPFMRAHNFCLLVTGAGGELAGSHLPCIVEERGERLALLMHMARTNPQWESFFDDEVLVVFSGPHAYISPRWYERKPAVPTWNYAAVHAYGTVRVLEDGAKHAAVAKLVAVHDPAWQPEFERLPAEYLRDMLGNIVAFEISVTRLETRWKLSQNRGRREQDLIIERLEASADPGERALAELTRKHRV
ncbi:MAG TPA: FMN-binding negative transcriptional regulator [Burkholderiales bacterium]|nr:FMN-binding negative transcriptional regulator [Burkholderiales bacterium]